MSKLLNTFGALFIGLGLGGCFQESVLHGLPCTADDQCANDQVCDSQAFLCVSASQESQTSASGSSTTDTGTMGEPCAPNGEHRCDPAGLDYQICTDGFWLNFDCSVQCMNDNEPPGKQAGACVVEDGAPKCNCADSIGGECEGNEPASCTEAGLLQFCDAGRFFGLMCSTSCGEAGYPVGGPCIPEGQGQGSASCQCADGEGGACTIAEQFQEGCENATIKRKCVDETWWLTDCADECARMMMSGGTCQDNGGGNFSCVCQ